MGATHLVNYRTHPDWENQVLSMTNGEGADIALEVVAGPNIEHTLAAIRRGGHVVHLGLLSDKAKEPVDVMPALWYGSKTSKSYRFPINTQAVLNQMHSPRIDRLWKQGNGRGAGGICTKASSAAPNRPDFRV